MKRWRLLDRSLVWFGNKSLDWLEKLPRFHDGAIADRQHVRERQREEADKAHERTRLPKGVDVDFLFFRLVETFPIEDADVLRQGLKRLLPFLESEFWHRDFSRDFSEQAKRIQAGGGWNLGCLVGKNTDRLFFGTESRKMPELPEEVSHVQIWLYHMFPSLFVLTFDVYLTEQATTKLQRVHSEKYLSTLRFLTLIPWGVQGSSHGGENTSERAIKHQVLRWCDELRRKVELCIERYVHGNFLRQPARGLSVLPAIEVFALKGAPAEPDTFKQWFRHQRAWWIALGFGWDFLTYKSKELLYVDPADDSPYGKPAQRFVLLWEPYLSTLAEYSLSSGDRYAVIHQMSHMLNTLLPVFVVLDHLQSVQKNIERLRKVSFDMMRPRWLLSKRMGKYLNFSNAIQRHTMLLERLSMEYELAKKQIELDVGKAVSDIKMDDPYYAKHLGETLSQRLVTSVTHYTKFLRKNHDFIAQSFSQYLATKNMRVMYQLQKRMFLLTVAVMFATFFTIAAEWQNIKTFISDLTKLLTH